MFDVVVRPEAGCLTVVHDTQQEAVDAVSVTEDGSVSLLLASGGRVAVGVLTRAMAEAAALCKVAVVVRMAGPYVASSAQARLLLP